MQRDRTTSLTPSVFLIDHRVEAPPLRCLLTCPGALTVISPGDCDSTMTSALPASPPLSRNFHGFEKRAWTMTLRASFHGL
jgi:hypothetical protein